MTVVRLTTGSDTPLAIYFRAQKIVLVAMAFGAALIGGECSAPCAQGLEPCEAPNRNPIVCENQQPGAPASEWDIVGAGDPSIQGFATEISVNHGETISFKVKTTATNYRLDIYRLGYYGGFGARRVTTVLPTAALPQSQPACLSDPATGLLDCGWWEVSASWVVPATAASGVYLARLVRADTGGASHIVFIVRDDDGRSDLLFQTSDTTWQAYNDYGGNSLYSGWPVKRAYKVSYNRPFVTRGNQYARAWLFGAEYPMIRWLEANGYSVSYAAGADTERRGGELLKHRVFLSVGHDEYWSAGQRTNVEAARAAGVHLAFFSGNEVFWKTHWENSIAAGNAPYRTLVCYKETHANAKIDPLPNVWTGTWRDARFSPPADGGRPENALTGTIFIGNCCSTAPVPLTVSSTQGRFRFWRSTSLASLPAGQSATVAPGVIGYEFDADLENGVRPAGLMRLSTSLINSRSALLDNGSTYGAGPITHALTLYRHASGALVFGAGTIRWSWALDVTHDPDTATAVVATPSVTIQQATVNLLADMGAQPQTMQSGLVSSSSSTDTLAPRSTIGSPVSGIVAPHSTVAVSGTAADAGGGEVSAVEVSVDGGTNWHLATGTQNWTYAWESGNPRTVTVLSRAVDDSGNIEPIGAGVTITVGARTTACLLDSVVAADPGHAWQSLK